MRIRPTRTTTWERREEFWTPQAHLIVGRGGSTYSFLVAPLARASAGTHWHCQVDNPRANIGRKSGPVFLVYAVKPYQGGVLVVRPPLRLLIARIHVPSVAFDHLLLSPHALLPCRISHLTSRTWRF